MPDPRRVEIGDETYALRGWSADDGDRWFFKLAQVALKARGVNGSEEAALFAVFDVVDADMFLQFRDVCIRYTDLIGRTEDGAETVRPLHQVKNHMRGKYPELIALMKEHVTEQFADPFSRAVAVFAGGEKAPSKSPSLKE
jgi:hypothetical protein